MIRIVIIRPTGKRFDFGGLGETRDVKSSEQVLVINQTAANHFWPNGDALGKMLSVDTARRVVGIVGDVRRLTLEGAAGDEVYLPLRQECDYNSLTLIVRLAPPVRGSRVARSAAFSSASPRPIR